MECQYEELLDSADNEYGLNYPSYGEPETIKCFRYDNGGSTGKMSFGIINNSELINNATKAYNVIDTRVKEGDRLDGRIVNAVDNHYDLHGRFSHKLCSVV